MHALRSFAPWWESKSASRLHFHSVTLTSRFIWGANQGDLWPAYDVHHVMLKGNMVSLPCNGHQMWVRLCPGIYEGWRSSALRQALLQSDLLTHTHTEY